MYMICTFVSPWGELNMTSKGNVDRKPSASNSTIPDRPGVSIFTWKFKVSITLEYSFNVENIWGLNRKQKKQNFPLSANFIYPTRSLYILGFLRKLGFLRLWRKIRKELSVELIVVYGKQYLENQTAWTELNSIRGKLHWVLCLRSKIPK